jgi:hypothetical protein
MTSASKPTSDRVAVLAKRVIDNHAQRARGVAALAAADVALAGQPDPLYDQIWPTHTTEAPDELYDSLFPSQK